LIEVRSPRVSNAQRLPNGNTLTNEGSSGRFFEVTAEGDVVWEYVNPYFVGPSKAQHNRVARAYRCTAEEIAKARTAAQAGERERGRRCLSQAVGGAP